MTSRWFTNTYRNCNRNIHTHMYTYSKYMIVNKYNYCTSIDRYTKAYN